MMANNDVYTENFQFHSSIEIGVTSDKASGMTNVVPMKQNSLYQAAPLLHPRPPSAARGKFIDGIDSEDPCTNTSTDHL